VTHPFPLYVLRGAERQTNSPELDWPARIGIGLTLAKIPIAVFILLLIAIKAVTLLNWTIVFTMLIDIADGEIFNRSNYAANRFLRESRRIWDGTLDRVVIWSTLSAAVLLLDFPVTLFLFLMFREFAVVLVTSYPYFTKGFVHAPNLPSKIGAILIAVQLIFFTTTGDVPFLATLLFAACSLVGLWLYVSNPRRI
jgi:phosphatidylglycerophosphate synthase